VLEVTGSSAVIPEGVKALRPGGHYIWAGMVHPETKLDLTGEAVLRKCLTLRGVHNYAPYHLAAGLDFLAQNHTRLPFEKLTGRPLPLEQLNEGIELTRSRQWQRVAIQPGSLPFNHPLNQVAHELAPAIAAVDFEAFRKSAAHRRAPRRTAFRGRIAGPPAELHSWEPG
jgi:hypothetical protein